MARKIVFTRRVSYTGFDIGTIQPDGSKLQVLTMRGGNNAYNLWTADERIIHSTTEHGFRHETAIYDDTFQPYRQIMTVAADVSKKRLLVNSMWEDSMPLYVPNTYLDQMRLRQWKRTWFYHNTSLNFSTACMYYFQLLFLAKK